jgi:hypothetical protein
MDGYGINVTTINGNTRRYRHGGQAEFELKAAAELAEDLAGRNGGISHVTIGNGEHEFRLIGPDGDPEQRWSRWYVDVEIGELTWRYRPLADLDTYDAAEELARSVAEELPEITHIRFGSSDGNEEYETDIDAG